MVCFWGDGWVVSFQEVYILYFIDVVFRLPTTVQETLSVQHSDYRYIYMCVVGSGDYISISGSRRRSE